MRTTLEHHEPHETGLQGRGNPSFAVESAGPASGDAEAVPATPTTRHPNPTPPEEDGFPEWAACRGED
ncbi:hypothetical protein [Candidatus Methylocalor cossyra]|uniref:Uncharacterized protein n=1 Tax=Candidatus Methylocalor cossyra TaxID=3108543 RepID=A0ABM9NG51_9GAMM